MSKYKVYDVQFAAEPAFRAALHDVCVQTGKQFEEAAGNDLHLVGFMGDTRPETAKYVVRRRHLDSLSNDLGFAVQPDGTLQPVISSFDSAEGRVAVQILEQVKARYAYHQTVALAYQNGYTVAERVLPDGTVQLELQRYY